MKKRALSLVLALLLVVSLAAACGEKEEEPNYDFNVDLSGIATKFIVAGASVHDPSILRVGDTYYIYGSHMASARSEDLFTWKAMSAGVNKGNVIFGGIYDKFDEAFAFAGSPTSAVPTDNAAQGGEHVWAPDVKYNENLGKYVMYYCTSSTWNASNLCYATCDTPDGRFEWQGAFIFSGFNKETIQYTDVLDYVSEDYAFSHYLDGSGSYKFREYPNAIDPTLFTDENGNDWLVYGSWSGGIFLLEVDEQTGQVIHPEADPDNDVDPYFGKRIAGGGHETMEAPYIIYDKGTDFYYLYVSFGDLNQQGGYQIRVFRSENPDGPYVDMKGQTLGSGLSRAAQSYYALKLSGNYQMPSNPEGYMATGHNSVFIDEDGKHYVVYHTRFETRGEMHYPRVHQFLYNADGWPCMLPYQTQGETVSETGYSEDEVAGRYFYINQGTGIDAEIARPQIIYLNKGGKVKTADAEGTWSMDKGSYTVTIKIGEVEYKGVFCAMKDEAGTDCMTFSAVGQNESIWGVKYAETTQG